MSLKKQKVDYDIIERVKDENRVARAVSFYFYDINGKYASKTKKPYVRAKIEFDNGKVYEMNAATFEAFGDYGFEIGIREQ